MADGYPKGDCWLWDGYLGVCKERHSPIWWQYVNVYSITATVAIIALIIIATTWILRKVAADA